MRFWMTTGASLLAVLGTTSSAGAQPKPEAGKQIVVPATQDDLGYLLYLPTEYKQPDRQWPVILFLHGAGERGSDLALVKKHGPPKIVEKDRSFPFVVISPQCPRGERWSDEKHQQQLIRLLKKIEGQVRVDSSRIYLTGLSMGGFGSWTLAAAYPQYFAAVVPICGGGNVADAKKLSKLPIWAFHGGRDRTVPTKRSQEMVDAIKAAGGDVKLTIYPQAGHDSWTETYDNRALYKWLMEHRIAK